MPNEDIAPLFASPQYRKAVEDFLNLQSHGKQAYLIGAGCSNCVGIPLMCGLTDDLTTELTKTPEGKAALAILDAIKKGFPEGKANIEDYMSELVDHIAILDRRTNAGVTSATTALKSKDYSAEHLRAALIEIKKGIRNVICEKTTQSDWHRRFVNSVHGPLPKGQQTNKPPIDYFVLNYDTLLEDGLGMARRCYVDGFSGGITGWWDFDCYKAESIGSMYTEARLFKLHGSIDWCQVKDDPYPRRLRPSCSGVSALEPVLIWPASTKYTEARRDPFAQMLDHFRHTLESIQSSETILFTIGYSFSDLHINLDIQNGLYRSQKRLTLVSFIGNDTPAGCLLKWASDPNISNQIRVYAKNAFIHGENRLNSSVDLPWWKFESLVRLMEGEKL